MDIENEEYESMESTYEYDDEEGGDLFEYHHGIRQPEASEVESEDEGDDDGDVDIDDAEEDGVEEDEEKSGTAVDATASVEQPLEGDSIDKDEEVYYIPLDLSAAPQSLDNVSDCQVVNLHTGRPLISVGSRVYEGQWEDIIGTDMFFSQEAELIGVSRQHVKLFPGKLVKKEDAHTVNEGRLDGIDWRNPEKTKNRKATLMDKIAAVDRKKGKDTDKKFQEDDVEMAEASGS
ncbi:uncharacterized protein V1513DRAFT_438042 [Lipomyces chichibuensis]|uniref:uncharacterized protein n=1 Tax=Lipomyces chichibuensis TaxID=1546026 RepID=UPI003343676E